MGLSAVALLLSIRRLDENLVDTIRRRIYGAATLSIVTLLIFVPSLYFPARSLILLAPQCRGSN
jgi:hypothetical protein